MLVQRRGVHISPEAASQYLELMKLIRQQHEVAEPRGRPKNRVILAACGERLRTRQAGGYVGLREVCNERGETWRGGPSSL